MKNRSNWINDVLRIIFEILKSSSNQKELTDNNEIKKIMQFGIMIRLHIIEQNIRGIHEGLEKENYQKLTMDINSCYIHIKGILDNLASIINLKYSLKVKISNIDLSKKEFLKSLIEPNIDLKKVLVNYKDWLNEIKQKRDPISHRMPLYVPPGIVTSKDEEEEFHEINKKMAQAKDTDEIFEQVIEWQNISSFHPYVLQHDGTILEDIETIIRQDLLQLKQLMTDVFFRW